MLYLFAPVCFPEYRWFMGSILSVEVNTWFLIARRLDYKSNGSGKFAFLITESISAMFYLTWIVTRCIIYPMVLLQFFQLCQDKIQETGTYFHLAMIFIPFHFALCLLNLKWTYDLFKPLVNRWLGVGPHIKAVQNGL
jgi:hypothetical protein